MAGSVKDTDNGFKQFLKTMNERSPSGVLVGLLAAQGSQPKEDAPELTLLEVALVNEFGNDKIPERSFLRDWVDANRQDIHDRILAEFVLVFQRQQSRERALERLGLWAQKEIQIRITSRIPPPNAPATIKKKGSDVPLVNTGQLRSAISYLLEKA